MAITSSLLSAGIAAAKAGQRELARTLLTQLVEHDTHNEQGWLWLSGVVDDPEDQRICLENVLSVNPHNPHARRGLAQLGRPTPAQETPATPEDQPGSGLRRRLAQQQDEASSGDEPLPTGPLPAAKSPCPYCGAETGPRARRCPRCDGGLLTRAEATTHGSCSLTAAGVLWMLSGIGSILGVIGAMIVLTLIPRMNADPTTPLLVKQIFQPWLITASGVYSLFKAALAITIAVGLWRFRRWAYVTSFVVLALDGAFRIALVLVASRNTQMFLGWFGIKVSPIWVAAIAERLNTYAASQIGWIAIVSLALAVLVSVNHRLFFGRRVRIETRVPARTFTDHYRAALRNRSERRWYLAAREMEAAVAFGTADAEEHQILGLCYAQLGDFGRSIRELRAAITLEPGAAQIRDDLATVEKAARNAGRRYAI